MTTKLAYRQEIAEGTMAFHFEKPPGWTFEAGQAIDITLLAPSETDAEGNTRTFTIASAPYEKSVMVATRMRDTAFKRMLKVMPVGTAVQMEAPAGDLTLPRDAAGPTRQRIQGNVEGDHGWHRRTDGRPGRRPDAAPRCSAYRCVPVRRHRYHAVPEHCPRRGQRTSPSPDLPFLLEPEAGGCGIPRGITGAGEAKSQLQAHREHDRDGEVAPAVAR